MPRIAKPPEERRLEIIETAERMFREIGFARCSVDMIIKEIGVAKGTFYYHFRSKAEVLEAIVDHTLADIVAMADQVANDASMGALMKMELLLSDGGMGDQSTEDIAQMLHLPENRELHELTNIQSVLRLSPILARIVEQGNREGVFNTSRPLETIQFLFTGAQFLMDGGLFGFTDAEIRTRRLVAQGIIERALGAAPGSFHFMNPSIADGGAPGPT